MSKRNVEEAEKIIDVNKLYFKYIERGELENLKKLIEEYSLDINEMTTAAGNTGLMYAVHFKKKKVAGYLMQSGADTSIKNNNNETVADIAKNSKEMKDLLERRRLFY